MPPHASARDEIATFDADARFELRASVRELWSYREVVWAFAARRFRTRYKQAAFGVGWAVVQPLAFLALFSTFLRDAFETSTGSYAAGAYAALVGWQFTSAAISAAASSLINEKGILRKVYFPREAPILGAVGAHLPDLILNLGILFVMVPILGGPISWLWLLAPIPSGLMILSALAIGVPLASLSVYYRDFLYALPIGVQLLLFASPVAYPIDQLDARWHHLYAAMNPLVGPLDAFRSIFGAGVHPDWSVLGVSAGSALLASAIGYRILKALERNMADVA